MANVNSVQHAAKVEQSGPFMWATYEVAAIASAADTITMFTLPAGTTVFGGMLFGDKLDAHATPTLELDVGITGNADKFLNSGVISAAAILDSKPEAAMQINLLGELKDGPITVTTDTDVIITYTAAAATTGTGTVNLMMQVSCYDARVTPPVAPI